MTASNCVQRRALWLASAAVAIAMAATPAMAQATRSYDIPAQPASEGLRALARDSGLQIMAPAEDVRGIRTNPVQGAHTPMDALRAMVAGTGLEIVQTGENTVAVRRAAPGAVAASSGEEVIEEVVVTGSRIARAGFDTLQAATVVGSEQIERRGYTNVLEALQDTPGFGTPGNGPMQTSQGNVSVAQSFANFFGLGSQRTLTLVNGRRYVSANSVSGSSGVGAPGSQVDLNLIPAGLVKQVETVAIGGAPVYGSDAIAGTVNIILKDDFEGVQTSLQYGVSDRGDAQSWNYRLLAGTNFADDRGNVVVSAEYSDQEGMLLSERMPFHYLISSGNTNRTDGIPSQKIVEDMRYSPLTEGGLPFRSGFPMPSTYITSGGQPLMFGPNGELVPFVLGTVAQASGGIPVISSGGDGLNPAEHTSLLSPTERYLLNFIGHFDVTENVRIIGEASYSKSTGEKLSDLYQFAAPGILGGPTLNFSINNPFLSTQARNILAANGVTNTFRMNRNLNDIADRQPGTTELEVYRFVVGLEGEFGVGDENWSWDVSYNYGRSRNTSGFNMINQTRFLRAVDAVGTTASPVCAVNADAIATNDDAACVPINLFGVGAASDAAVAYVVERGEAISRNTQSVLNANLSGRLPFGLADRIAFNVGAERRTETGWFYPDDVMKAGITLLGGANAFAGVEGEYTTKEVYGEAVVPLINDDMGVPLIKSAQFEGAARYVDHSLTGGATTWSAGGRVAPRLPGFGDGLVLRGVYTHSIRSPAITELFLGSVGIAGNTQDVCGSNRYNIGPNPAVRAANCAAALAAVGAPPPSAFNPTTVAVSAFGTRSGNPNLENESANSWSVGFVYQPPAIPGLSVAIDYSSIKLKDAISNLTLPQLESACYDSSNFPNESACTAFRRLTAAEAAAQPGAARVAGDIADGYSTGFFNTASRHFAGAIAAVQYGFDLSSVAPSLQGAARLGLKASWIDKDNRVALPGSPMTKAAGTTGVPRWTLSGNVGYSWEKFDIDTQIQWTDDTVGDRLATIEDTPINHFPSYTRVDLTVGYEITENLRAQLAVRNLFDKDMPYEAEVFRLFSPYDPIGRSYLLKLTASF